MSAPESWEDMDAQMNPNGVPRLNANAPSFSFNVNAPMYAPPNPYYPRPPPPHHQQQQPYFHPQFPINNPYIPQPQPQPQFHSRRPYVPPSQSGMYHPPPSDAHAHAHNSNNMMMTPPPTATSRSVVAPPPPSHSVTMLPPAAQDSLSKPTETTVTPKEDAHQPQTEEKMTGDSGSAKADASLPQSSSGNDNEDKIVSGLESLKVTDSNPSKDSDSKNEENVEENYEDSDVEDDEIGSKLHMNVVFIGHVDAGKSTIGGRILFLSNMVDERTIQKYEKEAKEKNRESWYMAYIMDTNEEERSKGITVEVGRAHFETEKKRITILDAPGHKSYVPNMISGASQADVGVLVISARKGEFETGFERGGQTREHAMLAKTLGVCKLICVVNKMDDPSVEWSKERFDDIEKKTLPFLKSCGYNLKKDVQFIPISGLLGANLKERMPRTVCAWWDGPCLFEALDDIVLPPRDPRGPVRMPIIDRFKDMGTVVMGKVESGTIKQGRSLIMMPNKAQVKVVSIYRDNDEVKFAKPGENVRVKLSGVEEEEISAGFVLSSIAKPIHSVAEFDAQLQILELLDHKAIFTAGYKAILHIHSAVEECEITELLHQIDPKTRKPIKRKTLFVKSGAVVMCRIQVNYTVCVEKFSEFPQLGRFTLRDEGKTVAIGKVTNLPKISA